MTGCKSTLSRERQVEGQKQTPKPERKSHDQHEQHRHQHVQELWQNWTLGERLLETRWRSVRQFHQYQQQHSERQEPQERQREKQTRGRCGTNQPSETAVNRAYPSQTPSTIGEVSCNSNVEPWIMGVTINSVSSTRRQIWCRVLRFLTVVHSFSSCPIKYPGQKVPLPDPGIHTASGVRLPT